MKLVLASHNPHKAREFERLLPGFEVEPYAGDLPEETGVTFRDNAELKARHVHAAIGGAYRFAPTDWNLAGFSRNSLISTSSSTASSTPATSLNVTFGASFETIFARVLPKFITRFPPACELFMIQKKNPIRSRNGRN